MAELYAESGIVEYWIFNLNELSIEVHRDPKGGRYRSVRSFSGDGEIRPLALPDIVVRPSMFF